MKAQLALAGFLVLDVLSVLLTATTLFVPVEYMDIPLPEAFRMKRDVHAMGMEDVWLKGIAMGRSRMFPAVVLVYSVLVLHLAAFVVLVRKLGKKS